MRGLWPAHLYTRMHRLRPNLFAAFPGDRAIVLDVAADRYRRLDAALSSALRQALTDTTDSDAVAAVVRSGLIAANGLQLREDPPLSPSSRAACDLSIEPFPLGLVSSATALAGARLHLRRSGLAFALAEARRRAAGIRADNTTAAIGLSQHFARHRRWLPLARRCLPDGLALHELLCRHALAAQLVIGVRDQPFAAHCWVQCGDTVLSDPLETVAELTAILIL